ncbi:MAG: gamma carbonic anhydrase family protein [Nitrospinae bacterium]|nr:gamma carbonic anhydrase family protein [Nitrospinota bacterium]
MIRPWRGIWPKVDSTAHIEQSAQVIGDVTVGPESSLWFNVVARGDVHYIRIGARSNVQDGSVLHVTHDTWPLEIGDEVTVGHSVTLHGCVIEGPALIGMGAVILDGARLAPNVIVAAGSLVPERSHVPPNSLVMGLPAKVKRELTEKEIASLKVSADNYVRYRLDYMEGGAGA